MQRAHHPIADRASDRPFSPTGEATPLPQGKGGDDSARICLGAITGPHGVKGMVRVKSFTADPEDIVAYGPLQDERGERSFEIELVGAAKEVLLARIKGVDDRNAAERLKGVRLYVRRADMPAPDEEEFYHADLVGLAAMLEDGTRLGTVVMVHDYGAGASVEIEDTAGKSLLVPFTGAAVPTIDMAQRRIVVAPPEGLFDAPQEVPEE
jgi:16S rRNA processing protein RimM